MKRIYVAGPMREEESYGFPAFDSASERLRAFGYEVVNPADLDREDGLDPDVDLQAFEEAAKDPEIVRRVLARDMANLGTCDEMRFLPRWEKSRGAQAESAFCAATGIPVAGSVNDLLQIEELKQQVEQLTQENRRLQLLCTTAASELNSAQERYATQTSAKVCRERFRPVRYVASLVTSSLGRWSRATALAIGVRASLFRDTWTRSHGTRGRSQKAGRMRITRQPWLGMPFV